jgi:acyl-CoA thioester hydrolase
MKPPPSDWPDLAGRIVANDNGREHVLPVRVYFEDTDFSGIVYHASYLRWIERGRSDFLRLAGVQHHKLLAGEGTSEPGAFAVRRMTLDYKRPARIDEVLEVRTSVAELTAASLILAQRVRRGTTELFSAEVQVVLVGQSGRVLRMPATLRRALTS